MSCSSTGARCPLTILEYLGVGLVAASASAFVCVRRLLRHISRHDFTIFAWYRIGFGIIVLLTAYSGAVSWTTDEPRMVNWK